MLGIFDSSSKIHVRASTIFGESEWRVPKETSLSTVAFIRLPSIWGRILSRSHWACAERARKRVRKTTMRFMGAFCHPERERGGWRHVRRATHATRPLAHARGDIATS